MTVRVLTREQMRAEAAEAVAALGALGEAVAWEWAREDPYVLLSRAQLDALDRLDQLDFLATGYSRGCHYGGCDPLRLVHIDTSWRTTS